MQPTLRHVPPSRPFSIRTTRRRAERPESRHVPAGPLPMMRYPFRLPWVDLSNVISSVKSRFSLDEKEVGTFDQLANASEKHRGRAPSTMR